MRASDSNPPLARAHVQDAADERADGAADQHGRTFAPAYPPGSEDRGRREQLERDDPPTDRATSQMKRLHHGVPPASARLGDVPGQEPACEAADGGQEAEEPWPERLRGAARSECLAVRAKDRIAGELVQEQPLKELDSCEERGTEQAGRRAHEGGAPEHAPEDAKIQRRAVGEEDR